MKREKQFSKPLTRLMVRAAETPFSFELCSRIYVYGRLALESSLSRAILMSRQTIENINLWDRTD